MFGMSLSNLEIPKNIDLGKTVYTTPTLGMCYNNDMKYRSMFKLRILAFFHIFNPNYETAAKTNIDRNRVSQSFGSFP